MKYISLLHNIIVDFDGYFCLHSRWSQHDSLSLPPTRATRKQRTNKLGRCYQPERPFCTLTRYTLRRRTAPFTRTYEYYMCLSAQVSGRETRVHAARWHAGHSRMQATRCCSETCLSRRYELDTYQQMFFFCGGGTWRAKYVSCHPTCLQTVNGGIRVLKPSLTTCCNVQWLLCKLECKSTVMAMEMTARM